MKRTVALLLVLVLCFTVFATNKSKVALTMVPVSLEHASTRSGSANSLASKSIGYSVEVTKQLFRHWTIGVDVTASHFDFYKVSKVCSFDNFVNVNSYFSDDFGKRQLCTFKVGGGFGLNLEMLNDNADVLEAYFVLNLKTGLDFYFTKNFGVTTNVDNKLTFQPNGGVCYFLIPNVGFSFAL